MVEAAVAELAAGVGARTVVVIEEREGPEVVVVLVPVPEPVPELVFADYSKKRRLDQPQGTL